MRRSLLVTGLLVMAASTARAQDAAGSLVMPQFGAFAGISVPVGSLARTHVAGFNVGALAEYRAPGEAVGVRAEALYEDFAPKTSLTPGTPNKNNLALTMNVLYHVAGYDFRPYIIGGMGFYHISGQNNHPGLNLGLGMDIPLTGFTAHLEARVHRPLIDGPSFVTVPISFGVRF